MGGRSLEHDIRLETNKGLANRLGTQAFRIDSSGNVNLRTGIITTSGNNYIIDASAAASGESDIVLGDNLASAFAFRESTTDYLKFVTTNSAEGLELGTLVRPSGFNNLSRRYELKWVAGERGKPGLNADITNGAEATRMIADPNFELLGTNASSDDSTFYAEGGLEFTTDGADNDQVIILPHLDANQSAWTQVTWGTDKEIAWECDLSTGGNIGNAIIWAGLKLTNTPTVATDNDQVFFRYQNGVSGGAWVAHNSIGGTDDSDVSSTTVAINTRYHLKIVVNSSRQAVFFINGAQVGVTAALTDATDLIPYIGVQASGAAEAKTIRVYGQSISRVIG